jgi:hypothetical protein
MYDVPSTKERFVPPSQNRDPIESKSDLFLDRSRG